MYQQIFMYTISTTITLITESVISSSLNKASSKNYLEEAVFFEIIAKFSKWC